MIRTMIYNKYSMLGVRFVLEGALSRWSMHAKPYYSQLFVSIFFCIHVRTSRVQAPGEERSSKTAIIAKIVR